VEAVREEGHTVCGVLAICDRLAGGAQAIADAADAPFMALTTIDEIYPQRPDRDEGHG
jgi:orotate phosphoribosyltransferase